MTKGTVEWSWEGVWVNTTSRVEGQDGSRLGQTMGVGRNEGQERMHRVDKMDKDRSIQEGKLEIWKEEGLG